MLNIFQTGAKIERGTRRLTKARVVAVLAVASIGISIATSQSPETDTSASGTQAPTVAADETQYLIFGANIEPPLLDATKTAEMVAPVFYEYIDARVAEILQKVGATGDGTKRQLGFMIILPVWLWNSGSGQNNVSIDEFIKQAFEVAKQRNMAIYFSIDSNYGTPPNLSNWYDPSAPGYNPDNRNNVEWTDWEGTPTKARYSLQASGAKLPPVMCYNSPRILTESAYLASQIVAPAILQGIDNLKSSGKEYLFAGITISMELSLDDYSVIDKIDKNLANMMEKDGAVKGRLGYCALTNLGYSKSNPPADYADALAKVNQAYAAYWAQQLVKAGLSKDKLYGHVAAGAEGAVLQYTNAPIWTAFNDYSRPGWTTYMVGPIADNLDALYEALAKYGNPHWASTEASPTSLTGKPLDPEAYLAWHYNYGAAVVMINSGDPSSGGQVIGKDIWSSKSIAAYQKFLSGETLQG